MGSEASRRIRATLTKDGGAGTPIAIQRAAWEAAAAREVLPRDVAICPAALGGPPGEWVGGPWAAPGRALLHLHGGGFSAGSPRTHRALAARLGRASGARVLLPDYRLAPEHPFPAAIEDAAAAYRWLLAQGLAPGCIGISGDSAGGNLALGVLLQARAEGVPLPAAAVLLSPWLDLALGDPLVWERAAADPSVALEALRGAAALYLAAADPQQPLASPLRAELTGLPPLLVQVGGDELLLCDATRLAARARQAGVAITLDVWDGLWHVFQAHAGELPEGQEAIERIGAFLRRMFAGGL